MKNEGDLVKNEGDLVKNEREIEKDDEIAEKVLKKLGLCVEIEEFAYDAKECQIVRESVRETAKEIFERLDKLYVYDFLPYDMAGEYEKLKARFSPQAKDMRFQTSPSKDADNTKK